mmetsp:Transcript_121907/g.356269  ORF Transcript_121907/g.356269 Transcript_121907/m.356269 type:complete len:296 (+) Transcript_121907:58-945(+)
MLTSMTQPPSAPRRLALALVLAALSAKALGPTAACGAAPPRTEASSCPPDEEPESSTLLQVASSSLDLRSRLPACSQYRSEWCWATAIAEVSAFFNESYRVFNQKAEPMDRDCHCVECYVAGLVKHPEDPHACCPPAPGRASCWYKTGTTSEIMEGIRKATGTSYICAGWYGGGGKGPISQQDLDKVVAKKAPIILEILWCSGGGMHYVTLAGGDGKGAYYVHDPLYRIHGMPSGYQKLSYQELVRYNPPEAPEGEDWDGRWIWTGFIDDPDLSEIRVQASADICSEGQPSNGDP